MCLQAMKMVNEEEYTNGMFRTELSEVKEFE